MLDRERREKNLPLQDLLVKIIIGFECQPAKYRLQGWTTAIYFHYSQNAERQCRVGVECKAREPPESHRLVLTVDWSALQRKLVYSLLVSFHSSVDLSTFPVVFNIKIIALNCTFRKCFPLCCGAIGLHVGGGNAGEYVRLRLDLLPLFPYIFLMLSRTKKPQPYSEASFQVDSNDMEQDMKMPLHIRSYRISPVIERKKMVLHIFTFLFKPVCVYKCLYICERVYIIFIM